MAEFVSEGGSGMMPVIVLGAVALATALGLAVRPSRRLAVLVLGASSATLISGALGTVMGLRSVARAGELTSALASSLHPLVLALMCLSLVAILGTIGAYRLVADGDTR